MHSDKDTALHLRAARDGELEALSALCLRSKAAWGYDKDFMNACRSELTFASADLATSRVQVAERDGELVGVAQITAAGGVAHLEKLFVEPYLLRAGVGRELFAWAIEAARELGAHTLVIESDPGAAAFYRRMGARDDGVAPSGSIPGRFLPRLTLDLDHSTASNASLSAAIDL
jgi:N-acetylglutamate synthase-like GNAT family acetyltransferase